MHGVIHFNINLADCINYLKDCTIVFIDLHDAMRCLWKVKCQDYSVRTNKTVAYEF